MHRRGFLKGTLLAGLLWGLPARLVLAGPGPIHQLSIPQLRTALDEGRLTPAAVLDAYRDRIRRYDARLRAIIELAADPKPGSPGEWLSSLPLLVKDNIATGDGLANSAGSLALESSRPSFSAPLVDRLRKSGALILGKTNMSEWANFRSSNSSSGWSARGGQCRNPHVLDRSPCGSSSGSAAAVAAGMAVAALGTETNGSIVCPSATCGVVGLKPSIGLLPGAGIIPISHRQDTAGPIGRNVQDVAILLSSLAGRDYSHLDSGALRGARLGVARGEFGFESRVDALMEAQLGVLSQLGAVIVDPVQVPTWNDYGPASTELLLYEFKQGLNEYLARLGPSAPVKTLADVIAFNEANPVREGLPYFGQDLLIRSQQKGSLSEHAYREAHATVVRMGREQGLDRVFQEQSLDAIVGPSNGPAWTIDQVNGDHYEGGAAGPPAVAGYPHITVPAGQVMGLPVGLSLYARPQQEHRLLNLAYSYEQKTQARVEPQFLDSLGL